MLGKIHLIINAKIRCNLTNISYLSETQKNISFNSYNLYNFFLYSVSLVLSLIFSLYYNVFY